MYAIYSPQNVSSVASGGRGCMGVCVCACLLACVRYASTSHTVTRSNEEATQKKRKKIRIWRRRTKMCSSRVAHSESIFFSLPLSPSSSYSHSFLSSNSSSSFLIFAGFGLLLALVFPYALVAHHVCACAPCVRMSLELYGRKCIPFIYFYDQLVSYEVNTGCVFYFCGRRCVAAHTHARLVRGKKWFIPK